MSSPQPRYSLDDLLAIMARLRDPAGGCPWDLEQTFATIAPHTIEEAYEVADAIAEGDMAHLCEELGDLLLQVVFHAQMAAEARAFDFADVVQAIAAKMVKRHPHVFADASIDDADAQTAAWEAQKAAEREAAARAAGRVPSALDDVARGLPALIRAIKLQKRAARVGFDWSEAGEILAKIREELDEVEDALPRSPERVREEVGDLLFAVTNLARRLDVEPETALADANRKFDRRFRHMEAALDAEGRSPEETDLARLDALWDAAKAAEAQAG
ncbi:nucleoside triphosphate pyrophosphohydrolase [Rhodothalassium salexigens]|uniref:nucleoside triphosphate pyrophosphohydrolase n=1 Tax=Rhodothalassium salexigens TaxID=1086 RepID=UPI0019120369|nr:nucleoside triphosphate pyrophosphohydrolase [Rhodothalassium salexigens]MBK5911750.1 nucleoside triphosphate pyrophosphohydrolase [Rhodothalassium salexigens]